MNSRELKGLLFPCFFRYAWEFSLQHPRSPPQMAA